MENNQYTGSLKDRLSLLILAHKTYTSMENHIWEKHSLFDFQVYLKDEFTLTVSDKLLIEDIDLLDNIIAEERRFFDYLYGRCFPDYNPDR
jgi:hypothetical protein